MRYIQVAILFLCFSITSSIISAQELPSSFLIGEHEEEYEKILKEYDELLLKVAGNSMDNAYEHWIEMLTSLEDYADEIEYDIKGIKIWLNVFWQKDGQIDHIVYYPKPNSRNVDFDQLTQFLSNFAVQYQSNLTSKKKFSHYGSASFPVFGRRKSDKG